MSRKTRTVFLLIGSAWVAALPLMAAPPARRIADINRGPAEQYFSRIASLGSGVVFSTVSSDRPESRLLWWSDGTSEGTRLLGPIDLLEGIELNGRVVFRGQDGIHFGGPLWATDGTAEGTALVLEDGAASSFVQLGDRVIFRASDSEHGVELWATDGTPNGTTLVFDVRPGPGHSFAYPFDTAGGYAYFEANDGVHGRELWKTDGTPDGTALVRDIAPGPLDSTPFGYGGALRNLLVFWADDGVHGVEPWCTDGTEQGTWLLRDILPGPDGLAISRFVPFDNGIVFAAQDPSHGAALWRTDGSPEGTTLLFDIAPGPESPGIEPVASLGDVLIFATFDDIPNVRLWGLRATTSEPGLLGELLPGPETIYVGWEQVIGNALYFAAEDGDHGREIWRSDGTPEGTHMVADLRPGAKGSLANEINFSLIALGDEVLFGADDGVHGHELFAVHRETGAARLVRDFQPWTGSSRGFYEHSFTDFRGKAYFSATDGVHGDELWKSDGSLDGTRLFANIAPGVQDARPAEFAELGDRLLFVTEGPASGQNRLWATDGNDVVVQLAEGNYVPAELTSFDGALWFRGWSPSQGTQLFRTDGTPEGTELAVFVGHAFNPNPRSLTSVSDGVIFSADGEPEHGNEMWFTGGLQSNTYEIGDLRPGRASSNPRNFTCLPQDQTVWFSAEDDDHGRELWRMDGFLPRLVRDIEPGTGGSFPEILYLWPDGKALIRARDAEHGAELWVSDGTAEGTTLLRDLLPGAESAVLGGALGRTATLDGIVYFLGDDGVHGEEPWRTDGTSEGTHLVRDIAPGPQSSSPLDFVSIDGQLLFSASDPSQGRELWVSDGTEQGTSLFQDVRPGPGSGDPSAFAAVGDRIFFDAFDDEAGYEPWSFRRCRLPGADISPPEGAVTAPSSGTCFGPDAVPVAVEDSFADRCDEEIVRTYFPSGGPNYNAHGDLTVNVSVADSVGNTASATRSFTIDLVPPVVTLVTTPRLSKPQTSSIPFALVWNAIDLDGATGGVTGERVFIDTCLVWDGATYGNRNGLLSDEMLVLGPVELCTLARDCGADALRNPQVRVEARDCGGNSSSATGTVRGVYRVSKKLCGL